MWDSLKLEFSTYSTRLTLEEYKNGRRTTTEWRDVHRSVITKIINARKRPEKTDIEAWIRDSEPKKTKQDSAIPCNDQGFWLNKEE